MSEQPKDITNPPTSPKQAAQHSDPAQQADPAMSKDAEFGGIDRPPTFKGKNLSVWKRRMEVYLESKGWEAATKHSLANANLHEFDIIIKMVCHVIIYVKYL